jgi:TIR domain
MVDASETTRHAFISHASADLEIASEIGRTLEREELDAWLDDSEIRLGVLLAEELQAAISACRVLILLWSEAAAASRWVNTEWLAAHHLDRFILPCVLDDTALPQCFEHSVHLDLRRAPQAAIARLAKAVRAASIGANRLPAPLRSESQELREAIRLIAGAQQVVTNALGQRNPRKVGFPFVRVRRRLSTRSGSPGARSVQHWRRAIMAPEGPMTSGAPRPSL